MCIKKFSRLVGAALVAVVCLTGVASAQNYRVGASVTATLSGGTLTIRGSGPMANYVSESEVEFAAPWWYDGKKVTRIIIEDGVTTIGASAFDGFRNLTSVTIPNSVSSIGSDAFVWCESLTTITIPSNVTSIGSGAFTGCTGLTSITVLTPTLLRINRDVFHGVDKTTACLHVPADVIDAYKSAPIWGDFQCIKVL